MLCWVKSALIRFTPITLQIQNKAGKNIYLAYEGQYEFKFGECHFVDFRWIQKNFSPQADVLYLLLEVSTSKFSAERLADTPKRLLPSSAKYRTDNCSENSNHR